MSRNIIILICIICTSPLYSQNLVVNSSFDSLYACPASNGGDVVNAKHWLNPTMGTPDLFAECGKSTPFYTKKNDCGIIANADSDTSFGGFIAFTYNDKWDNYREYIGCSLREKLVKDNLYKIKIKVCLAQVSKYSLTSLGISFFKGLKELNPKWLWTAGNLDIEFTELLDKPLSKRGYWVNVETTFKAQGGESIFILGNFNNPDELLLEKPKSGLKRINNRVKNQCYIYIDNIVIEKANATNMP